MSACVVERRPKQSHMTAEPGRGHTGCIAVLCCHLHYIASQPVKVEGLSATSGISPCLRRHFDFEVKDHVQLGASLGLIDFEAGAAVAGTKFAYLRGAGALLEVCVPPHAGFRIEKVLDSACAVGTDRRHFVQLVKLNLLKLAGYPAARWRWCRGRCSGSQRRAFCRTARPTWCGRQYWRSAASSPAATIPR